MQTPHLHVLPTLSLVLALGCGGIATPSELPRVRGEYNESLVRSSNEQLVLNLVRLRYLHAPQFLEVTAVNTQSALTQSSSAGIVGNFGHNLTQGIRPPFATPSIGGSVSVSERPTVSYAPLSGEAFTTRMVRPMSPRTILSLVNVGWRIDRLLSCCVARVNDLSAPVIASRDARFGSDDFRRLGELLYLLQERGVLSVDEVLVGEAREVRLSIDATPSTEAAVAQMQEILGLDPSVNSYRVLGGHPPSWRGVGSRSDYIVLRGRSLLGALFYLSHGVEVAAGDDNARSLDYVDEAGQTVDVSTPVEGALLSVRASDEEPEGAYARSNYRGRWFSVSDTDLESKQMLLLLQLLFSALSAGDEAGPTLTLPIGG